MWLRPSLLALVVRFWMPFAVVMFYALWRGGAPERRAAIMLIVAAIATLSARTGFTGRYEHVNLAILLIDCILMFGLVWLALEANRQWPVPLAALHAITILGHMAKLANPGLQSLGYAVMISWPALPGLAVLAIGTYRHGRRLTTRGADASWNR